MKKILIIILAVIIVGVVIISLLMGKKSTPSTTASHEMNSEQLAFTDEPGHYKTTILESDFSEHIITLELYQDGTARMFFDFKATPPDGIATREEDGSFTYYKDATELVVELDSHGPWKGEQIPYNPSSTFTFVKTATGIEATAWDTTRYNYNTLNFIPVPEDEMYAYGDPTEM